MYHFMMAVMHDSRQNLSNPGQVGCSNSHNGAQLASRRLHERRKMGVKGSDVLMKYISVPWNLALRPLFA